MINDDNIKFVTQLMACKFLRKCHKDKCPTVAVKEAEMCVTGVKMRWAPFLLNQFIIDYKEVQIKGNEFHYSWTLIMISLKHGID